MTNSADIILFPRKPKADDEFSQGMNLTEIYEYMAQLRNELCPPKLQPENKAKVRKARRSLIDAKIVGASADHRGHTDAVD